VSKLIVVLTVSTGYHRLEHLGVIC